jgi:hypothetical protein
MIENVEENKYFKIIYFLMVLNLIKRVNEKNVFFLMNFLLKQNV